MQELYEPDPAPVDFYEQDHAAVAEEVSPVAEDQFPAGEGSAVMAEPEAASAPAVHRERSAGREAFEPEEQGADKESAPAQDPDDQPSFAARPRQAHERYVYTSPYTIPWLRPLLWGTLVAAGGVGGYFLGLAGKAPVVVNAPAQPIPNIRTVERPPPLTVEERHQLDVAYQAGREGRYGQSAQLFGAFSQKHRLSSKLPLEIARMDIYQADYIGAQKILGELMQGDSDARADAYFLSGVLNLKVQNYPDSELAFATATDADPTNAEYYYFWGDCLRQQGKPQEARSRFVSALCRNQYETAEDLMQLKVWLCDISMDQEKTNGASAAIDSALAAPYPRAAALLAAAARSIKVDRFNEAAGFIARGKAAMDQVVFNVVLQDPTFFQESWRPELAQFYAAEGAPAPTGTPAPAAPVAGSK